MVMYEKDMWIWADHSDDVWRPARIVEISQNTLTVAFLSGNTTDILKKKSWSILSIGSFSEDMQNAAVCKDLSKMSSLSTESVLHCLRNAYGNGNYYSNLGAGTILAVNPFQNVDGLFTDEMVHQYHLASHADLSGMSAHVFSVAERALRDMNDSMERNPQSIIISGESGAGKTWTVRCLMRYLAVVGMEVTTNQLESGDSVQGIGMKLSDSLVGDQIEHRILSSNPILEAFGNAATPRNHNSSRFGKYIQLQYDRCGNIVGAILQVYLLEKTRVTNHGNNEKPYHIFPQMVHGSSSAQKKEWLLPDNAHSELEEKLESNSNMNNNLNSLTSDDESLDERGSGDFKNVSSDDVMDNADAFLKTCRAISSVGIATSLQSTIFKILSAILNLEKMSFEGNDDLSTPCTLTALCQSNANNASILLSVPINHLVQAVTVREIQAGRSADRRRSVFKRSCTRNECSSRRDALMKYLYEQTFLWLVNRIGNDLSVTPDQACSFIGLLDVYGFESFQHNGLEQLCINYANEKLQQYYVNNFLKLQQEELALDGVMWEGLEISEKMGCLSVLESSHSSLFALLNEECRLNRSSNASQLKDRIAENFSESSYLSPPRISSDVPCFAVLHYAGSVLYETDSLIAKNKDELPLEIAHLLVESKNEFVQQLISDKVRNLMMHHAGARGKCHETVLTEFKKSLDDLLNTLSSTNCHYIRCIKPNRLSRPSMFDSFHVVDQLRSSGVVETVQICGRLHPHRMFYNQFISHFKFILRQRRDARRLSCSLFNSYDHAQQTCHRILSLFLLDNSQLDSEKSWKFGKTFVFLSSVLYELLEKERSKEMTRSATKIQLVWLSYCHKKRCFQLLKKIVAERHGAATLLQRVWRMKVYLRKCMNVRKEEVNKRKRAACLLQKAWTGYLKRQKLSKQRILQKEAIHATEGQPVHLSVQTIPSQHAILKTTCSWKTQDLSTTNESFEWVSRLKHNLVERYFPTMMLMNFCRICTYFLGPLDIVSEQYTMTGSLRAANTIYKDDHNLFVDNDSTLLSDVSFVDGQTLSPHSFSLLNSNHFASDPCRSSILPYSDVAPKHAISIEV